MTTRSTSRSFVPLAIALAVFSALLGLVGGSTAEAAAAGLSDAAWDDLRVERDAVRDLATEVSPSMSDSGPGQVTPRIAGGRPAADGEFPFTVYIDILSGAGAFSCTGSVITSEWVLTAAHCLTDSEGDFLPGLDVLVVAGATDLAAATPANVFAAPSLFKNSSYNPPVSGFASDVALVRLDRPVSVRGLPLPATTFVDPDGPEAPGVQGIISGYGLVSESPDLVTSRLHVGTARVLNNEDCGFYFGGLYVPGFMNCTGPLPGTPAVEATTCKGDSGGPLFVPFGGDYLQIGITSFGPVPCQVPRIGGYAKVSPFGSGIAGLLQAEQPSLGPPTATTGGVTERHDDGLTVQGTVNPNGIATSYEVRWGTTPSLLDGVVRGHVGGARGGQGRAYGGMGQDPVGVSARITGAPPGTEIFYTVTARSVAGASDGQIASGQTSAPPPPPEPLPVVPREPGPPPPPPSAADPVCNPAPTRKAGTKGTIRLTSQALAIQQRIDAAALRRLNAGNVWIDQGIVPSDLCAGSFGPAAFQPGIGFIGGAAVDRTPPQLRPLRIIKKAKPKAAFTVSRRQIRINDTISRALFARARATEARIANLTGGNLAQGATLTGRPLWPGLATTGPLPASQTTPATPLRIGPLPRAGRITVSAAQLRKTQRRSQQAIRIANRVNDRITQGLTESQFRPGSIGSARLG